MNIMQKLRDGHPINALAVMGGFILLFWLTFWGLVVWAVVHFVRKFW